VRIPDEIAPAAGDLVLPRVRTSAFAGSMLPEILRAKDVTTLYLAGFAISGVVLATACAADDLDLETTVLSDSVADPDDSLNSMLLRKVFPQYGRVATSTTSSSPPDVEMARG
jgi:nicotinamidase-related amidase